MKISQEKRKEEELQRTNEITPMSQGAIHALSAFVINEVASLSTRSCPLHSLVWEGLSHALGHFQQLL